MRPKIKGTVSGGLYDEKLGPARVKVSISIITYQFVEPWDLSPGHATGYHYSPGAIRCGAISVENNLMQGVLYPQDVI